MDSTLCPVSGQSEKEERFNTLTHFLGLLASVTGFAYLLFLSIQSGSPFTIFSSLVYGTTLILLYAASTYYHKAACLKQKQTLKVIDHACIYLLIAGSYTPFTLGPLKDFGGLNLLGIEWAIAAVGITLKVIAVDRFQWLSLAAYLGMGWLVIFSYEALIDQMTPHAIAWLIAGGLSYTLGTIFYVWDRLPYNHGIWHLFVLSGSACHYFCVLHTI